MHVVHLYDGHEKVYNGRGSVPNVVWNIARETAAGDHRVTVIERQWDDLPKQATHDGVDFRRLDLRTGASEPWSDVPYEMVESPAGIARLLIDRTNFALTAYRELQKLEFDVLHVHLPFAANVLITVAPWLQRRTVYTAHLGELRLDALEDRVDDTSARMSPEQDSSGQIATTDGGVESPALLQNVSPDIYLANRAVKTTVLNPDIQDVFVRRGVPRDRLEVVPNGVDLARFEDVRDEEIRNVTERYDLGDSPVLLFVGTVMPRKGVTDLIEAVASVVDDGHDVRLLVAGENGLDETYTRQVTSLIAERELEEHVELVGYVPDEELPGLYARADVFVMPSLEEGFGMAVVEAMAAGTPVIGSRVGAIPRLLGDDECGFVVDAGDVEAVADRISRLLNSSAARTVRSDRATRRAREFSWPGITDQFTAIYTEVRS